MFVLPFESLHQLHCLLNYFGCQQTAICKEGMFTHIMTTDSWCQAGYAFQFVSGNNNNYSSCKSSLPYSRNSFCCAYFPKHPSPRASSQTDRQRVGWRRTENQAVNFAVTRRETSAATTAELQRRQPWLFGLNPQGLQSCCIRR